LAAWGWRNARQMGLSSPARIKVAVRKQVDGFTANVREPGSVEGPSRRRYGKDMRPAWTWTSGRADGLYVGASQGLTLDRRVLACEARLRGFSRTRGNAPRPWLQWPAKAFLLGHESDRLRLTTEFLRTRMIIKLKFIDRQHRQ